MHLGSTSIAAILIKSISFILIQFKATIAQSGPLRPFKDLKREMSFLLGFSVYIHILYYVAIGVLNVLSEILIAVIIK